MVWKMLKQKELWARHASGGNKGVRRSRQLLAMSREPKRETGMVGHLASLKDWQVDPDWELEEAVRDWDSLKL
jgi:hypothetical protein